MDASTQATLTTLINVVGALVFGIVVGWITYRTIRRTSTNGLGDIATVIGAIGGAAITALFDQGTIMFGAYCIGLGIGFFAYLRTALALADTPEKKDEVRAFLGSKD